MKRALLDTDILSEIIKEIDPNVVARANAYSQYHQVLSFTSASVYEILSGLFRKNAMVQIQRTEAVFARNEEITPTRDDYRLAGEISGAVVRQGTPIGLIDPLIAACAIRRGLAVASGNTDHFGFIQAAGYSFLLEDWRKS